MPRWKHPCISRLKELLISCTRCKFSGNGSEACEIAVNRGSEIHDFRGKPYTVAHGCSNGDEKYEREFEEILHGF